MPSNRSKKGIFEKEADKTLKRQLISSEFRKYIMSQITGQETRNGTDALKLASLNNEYIELENNCNNELALYITHLRHKIANKMGCYNTPPEQDLGQGLSERGFGRGPPEQSFRLSEQGIKQELTNDNTEGLDDKMKDRYRIIIPADRFDEYWVERLAIKNDLKNYAKVSHLYDGVGYRVINDYVYSVESVLQGMYGSLLPIKGYDVKYYEMLLEIYEKHKSDYNLVFPSFPKEHLVENIIIGLPKPHLRV